MSLLAALPFYCLGLTILLLPWYIVRFSIAGVPVTLLEGSIGLTVVMWAFSLAVERRRPFLPNRYWLLWTVLFVVAATLSLWWSADHRAALGIYKAYILEPILLGALSYDLIRYDSSRLKWLIFIIVAAGWEIVLLCVSQFIFHRPVFAPAEAAQGRSSAVYNTANAVGLFIGPMAGMLLPWIWQRRLLSQSMWVLTAVTVIGLGVAIGLSKSRGGLLGLVAIFTLSLLFKWIGSWRWGTRLWRSLTVVLVIGYVVATVAWMWWFNHPPKVANPYTRPGFTTLTVRACTWEGTVKGLSLSPIKGFGLANFTRTYLKHYTCDAEPLVYPHNFVLNFWTETGMLGLFAISGLIIYWLWSVQPDGQSSSISQQLRLGLILVVVYCLVHGIVDVPYFKNDLSAEWWLWVGIAASLPAIESRLSPNV